MVAQLSLTDYGADPTHWHTLQGFYGEEYDPPANDAVRQDHEIMLSSHVSLEDARLQIASYRDEVRSYPYQYGVEIIEKSETEDRIDYDEEQDDEDFQMGWLRIETCRRWDCRPPRPEEE